MFVAVSTEQTSTNFCFRTAADTLFYLATIFNSKTEAGHFLIKK